MSQTVNGQDAPTKTPKTAPKTVRPGQRQQERMQRLARRQKRRRIIAASFAAFLLVALVIASDLLIQNYRARLDTANVHATATTSARVQATARVHAQATATVVTAHAQATATVVAKNCFITSDGPAIPSIYTSAATPTAAPTTTPAMSGTPVTLKDGLKYVDMKVGTGTAATSGSTVTVNYTGWLASTCQSFDSSYNSHTDQSSGQSQAAQPLTIALNQVIPGWTEGVAGMKPGGIRRLYIPSALGYGAQGSGSIPANADLIFDVQLISAK